MYVLVVYFENVICNLVIKLIFVLCYSFSCSENKYIFIQLTESDSISAKYYD